jgi:aerobic-type carbon monoxide dehydrogenase small subunit (CoxS/CutS family)
VALTEASQQSALEGEALQLFLEEEERQKQELRQALRISENKGKQFHEVCSAVYIIIHVHLVCACNIIGW